MSKSKIELPSGTIVPDHIALILDGNRRWARARGLSPSEGHKAGYKAVEKVSRAARDLGIHTFTAWALSTENWQERPENESRAIFYLAKKALKMISRDAKKEGTRFIHLGRKDRLPKDLIDEIIKLEEKTKNYTKHVFNLALDYGGQDEIVRATQKIIKDGVSSEDIDVKLFESYLDTHGQPYPYVDLFIRTSGEQRTSGLLPWQMAYAEFYFEPDHLPDFTPEKLRDAILDYSRRRRRFGGNDAVEHFKFNPEITAGLEVAWWRLKNIPQGERFRDYALKHIKEQYGLSKELAKDAAKYMIEAVLMEEGGKNFEKSISKLRKFYQLIKKEVKLAFEPEVVASLHVKFWRGVDGKENVAMVSEAENTARELYAEVYRISLFQAAKLAHLRVLANIEKNLAERAHSTGSGSVSVHHWARAEDYLQKFYRALKERVA